MEAEVTEQYRCHMLVICVSSITQKKKIHLFFLCAAQAIFYLGNKVDLPMMDYKAVPLMSSLPEKSIWSNKGQRDKSFVWITESPDEKS